MKDKQLLATPLACQLATSETPIGGNLVMYMI
jgi:hypothetical protein